MKNARLSVIGAGLAGSEAAWQAAQRGVNVDLFEMRPATMTPAHTSGLMGELVCSNSLRGVSLANAVGLLKEELRVQGSLIMTAAEGNRVPAGGALAVDREGFATFITERISSHPRIQVHRHQVSKVPEGPVVVATGPLTSEGLSQEIARLCGNDHFFFYDAAAPIVSTDSINMAAVYRASRYDKGGDAAYLNCPMTEAQYQDFWQALISAETVTRRDFEEERFFEGCLPVEELARRGRDTLRYGPLKPVGLEDPRTGQVYHAVVQLRQDNLEGTLYNLVGFQTNLSWPEQRRVFRMIPGLEKAEFVRLGVMHRNTFIDSPRHLRETQQFRGRDDLFFAGQLTGVEGYVESSASGLMAGVNASRYVRNIPLLTWPRDTAHGSLIHYITTRPGEGFQPMNITFGLLPPLDVRVRGRRDRRLAVSHRALDSLKEWLDAVSSQEER